MCPPSHIGTPNQVIWIKRGGVGKSGSGPTGYKTRPARVLARAMAELARRYAPKKKNVASS